MQCVIAGSVCAFLFPTVGYIVIYNQGYKLQSSLVGTVRMSLQQPAPDFRRPASELSFCGNGTYDADDFQQLPCRFLVRGCRKYFCSALVWERKERG